MLFRTPVLEYIKIRPSPISKLSPDAQLSAIKTRPSCLHAMGYVGARARVCACARVCVCDIHCLNLPLLSDVNVWGLVMLTISFDSLYEP